MICIGRFATAATRYAKRWTSRIGQNTSGVAAVEFAMVVPVMFTLFVGTVEFSQALTVDRRVTISSSLTADLIARAPSTGLSTSDVDASMLIVEQIMPPYDTAPLTITIVSVLASSNGSGGLTYKVDWSRNNKGNTPYAHNAIYTSIPTGLLSAGESVIVAETVYAYNPLIFSYFITSTMNLREKFYLKPRNAACISLLPSNCTAP